MLSFRSRPSEQTVGVTRLGRRAVSARIFGTSSRQQRSGRQAARRRDARRPGLREWLHRGPHRAEPSHATWGMRGASPARRHCEAQQTARPGRAAAQGFNRRGRGPGGSLRPAASSRVKSGGSGRCAPLQQVGLDGPSGPPCSASCVPPRSASNNANGVSSARCDRSGISARRRPRIECRGACHVTLVCEVEDAGEERALSPCAADLTLWRHRTDTKAAAGSTLLQAARDLPLLEGAQWWVACESSAMRAGRRNRHAGDRHHSRRDAGRLRMFEPMTARELEALIEQLGVPRGRLSDG